MKKIHLGFLLLLFTTNSFSQILVQDSVLVKKSLPNGLTYYIYPTDKVKGEGHFRLLVKVGSAQETKKQRGLAHFLEHMAFNGIKHFEANKLIDFLESNGSKFGHDLNAHTSFLETVYKLKIPTHNKSVIDSTLLIMSDWVNGMLLDSTEVEKERGVVLSEWLSKQSPQAKNGEVFLNTLLNDSRFSKRKVIGDTTSLKNFKLEELRNFYQKWYDPSLMAVAVTGDVNAAEIEAEIIARFGNIPASFPKVEIYNIENYKKDSLIVYSDEWVKKTELNLIQLRDPLKNVDNKEAYTHYLTRSLLNQLTSQRFSSLSFNDPVYKDASISVGNFLPVKGAFYASTTLKPEFVLAGIDQFNQHYKQIMEYGFTPSEIEKVKTKMLHSFQGKVKRERVPSASGIMDQINQDFFYGNKIISLQSELAMIEDNFSKIDSLTLLGELKKTNDLGSFRYLLTTSNKLAENLPETPVLFSHIHNRDSISVSPYKNTVVVPDDLLNITPNSGEVVKIKELSEIGAKEIYLDNGALVIYKKIDSAEDKIIISGFKQGGYYALDSTNYVNAMYASPIVSISGYGDFSREALSDYLTGNSAKVQLLIDKTRSGFSGSANSNDATALFELFYLKSVHPKVDTTLFDQVKDRMLKSLENKETTSKDAFFEELKYLIRGKDYTTKPQTVQKIQQNLTIESIEPIYNSFFGVADNYVITVLTDQELPAILPLIKTYFGGLPKGNISNSYTYKPKPILKKKTSLVKNTGESPKSIVSLVFQQDKLQRNIPKLQVENDLLESILKLKLTKRLREELGVVYGVGVAISSTKHPVPLSRQTISLVCNPKDVDLITFEIRQIIEGIVNGDIEFDQDLMKVKNNLIKNHKLKSQSNSYWTKAVRDYYFNGYRKWNFTNNYEDMVQSVTPKSLKKKAKKYFIVTPEIKAILNPKP
ncbi:hypothetical protein KCTC52924_01613 [Arenibacter antarcticus]|uniref:M16 family metallopeptidase n=1 Tax=Arenibacter antarcticus TaxID=2040469 RepID=A0ABW5VGZ2_9FLAO|nr:M16 family metallopeptidase [Arenibacter sp. H213]MCM4166762.1 peptidase M16 [Arenibacter sp. H213]